MIIVIIVIIDTIGTIISISLRGRQSRSGALSVGIGRAEAELYPVWIGRAEAERLAECLLPRDWRVFSGALNELCLASFKRDNF